MFLHNSCIWKRDRQYQYRVLLLRTHVQLFLLFLASYPCWVCKGFFPSAFNSYGARLLFFGDNRWQEGKSRNVKNVSDELCASVKGARDTSMSSTFSAWLNKLSHMSC